MVTGVLMGTAFSAKKNASMTYQWVGEAITFAAQAANQDGNLSLAASREKDALQWFGYSFSQITDTTYNGHSFIPRGQSIYPGPIQLVSFSYIPPGYPVPDGIASQPGYLAVLDVPVIGGELPFVGSQYVTVPMRYFGVIKSQVLTR